MAARGASWVAPHGPSLVWFRAQDLRLHDNPALAAAVARGRPIIPAFVWAPDEERSLMGEWAAQGVRDDSAVLQWLRVSVERLGAALAAQGLRLVVRVDGSKGATCAALLGALLTETRGGALLYNRRFCVSCAPFKYRSHSHGLG